MENYIEEIAGVCKLPFSEVNKNFKVILLSGRGIYISNYKKLVDYSDQMIVLKIHNDTLEIGGERLKIVQINKGEIIISGKINSLGLGSVNVKK